MDSEKAVASEIATAYESAGGSAVSVLTDGPFFGGCLEDLEAVRAQIGLPILRKDFMVDPYQVTEARAAGADAILLIMAALDDEECRPIVDVAERYGLDVLVEVHDEVELARALELGAKIIGVNHRNLKTFEVDTTLAVRLRDQVPAELVMVAESGIRTPADARRMFDGGIDAVLSANNSCGLVIQVAH